jgi:hypothetical protein
MRSAWKHLTPGVVAVRDLLIGCNGRGAQHIPGNPPPIDEQFRMVKASGVFDFFDRLPEPGREMEYMRAAERHDLPILTGLWTYTAGQDEALLLKNLGIAHACGGKCHNILLFQNHADGHALTDEEVVDFYRLAYEAAEKIGIEITFEVHIYMWSEDIRRVLRVAEKVEALGIPFNFLLDHSHVLIKLDSPEEQDLCGIRSDVASGRLILDPFESGNIIDQWIEKNMTLWHAVRPVAPGGPANLWESHPDGKMGRACQYPFLRPRPGEWHSDWFAYKLAPTKEVTSKVLRAHRQNLDSRLKYVTTEMIDMPDYGGGTKYSLFEHSVALAEWIHATWERVRAESVTGVTLAA